MRPHMGGIANFNQSDMQEVPFYQYLMRSTTPHISNSSSQNTNKVLDTWPKDMLARLASPVWSLSHLDLVLPMSLHPCRTLYLTEHQWLFFLDKYLQLRSVVMLSKRLM